jgi:hypothetical protein
MRQASTMSRRALGLACLALCAAGALALARGARAVDPVGVWTVVDYTATDPATGAVTRPFGRALLGSAIYTRGGHMGVFVSGRERSGAAGASSSTDSSPAGAAARAALRAHWLDSMYAYTGSYTLSGTTLTIHIESAWQPSWVGSQRTRTLERQGDVLTVTTPPMLSPVDGRTYVSVTRFRRVE